MIVVHVFHSFHPVLGGVERAMQRICEEFIRMGHEVHVVASTLGAEDRPMYEEINGVRIHRVKAWTLHYPDLTIPREIPNDLLRMADIVHGWSQNSFFTYRICSEAKKLGKPVVTYFIGVDYLKNHYNPLIRVVGYRYQRWVTKRIVKTTDLALVTNEYDKRILREGYELDAVVLPHGVDEVYLRMPNMAERFREKHEVKEGRIIAYVARIHPTKGLDLLIRAFAEIVRQVPGATLVIAGKGDENYLRKCLKLAEKLGIKDKVKYLGYISEDDKIALIDASEVVVLPTRHAGESYPLLIDEVVSRGKPMIVTNVSKALASRAEDLGAVVTHSSSEHIAKAIVKMLDIPKKNINYISSIRTWREIATTLLQLYSKLTANHGSHHHIG